MTTDRDTGAADRPHPPGSRGIMALLGPGLVTGAADDDPSGIATYSQVGAQFGYTLGWTMIFSFPLMAAIQAISARIGAVTGRGIASNLRRHYPRALVRSVLLVLVVANVINLGADLGAMGAAVGLLVGGPKHFYTLAFGVVCVLLQTFISYERYAPLLKWATLSLFTYVAVAFAAEVPLGPALFGAFVPTLALDGAHATALVAVLGTTISPYLFFWQAGQEVEELHRRRLKPLHNAPRAAAPELARIRTDTIVGMAFSNAVALFIMVAAAATLNANGVTNIETAAQAAEALRPIAGPFTFALFALGIISTGMLAVPVLAGAVAYAASETFGWTEGLRFQLHEARAFYTTIALATMGGVALNFAPIDEVKALYWSAVLNGILAAPLMAVIMMLASNPRVMGRLKISRPLAIAGWTATTIMALVSVGLFVL